MHLSVIWIVSLHNVFVFSTIDNWEVIHPYLFAFNFLGDVLILFFNMLQPLRQRERLRWQEMLVLELILLLDLKVCMWMTLKGRWVRFLPTMRGTSSLPSLVPAGSCRLHIFWPFFGLPFCFVCDGSSHPFLLVFLPIHQHNNLAKDLLYKYSLRGQSPSREDPHKRER